MNAAKLMQMFLHAAHHQIASSAEGKAILEAGLGAQLHELMVSTCGNFTQPLLAEIDELVQSALGVETK